MFTMDLFTINMEKKLFVSKLSDLGFNPFTTYSKTNKKCIVLNIISIDNEVSETNWVINNIKTFDNKVVSFHLTPTFDTIRDYSALKDYKMIILND